MKKAIQQILDNAKLDSDERSIGAFIGRGKVDEYDQSQILVTSKRVLFGRMSILMNLERLDSFNNDEILNVIFESTLLGITAYKITFIFIDGKKSEFTVQKWSLFGSEGATINEETKRHLEQLKGKTQRA